MFSQAGGDDEPAGKPEHRRPAWFGPTQDELGVAVPVGVVVGRSENGVVALSHALAHSTGASFAFVAQARGLGQRAEQRLFQEQHIFEPDDEELPDGFLCLGLELPDGARVSNLGGRSAHRMLYDPDAEPEGPLFFQHGGGGGSSGGGLVDMQPGYWLWPLPPAGPIKVSCEWPVVGIALSTVEIDGAALVAAAERVVRLWPSA